MDLLILWILVADCNTRTETTSLPRAMAETRKQKVSKISALLYQHCILPDPNRFAETGSITPTQSLRHKATRECLKWTSAMGHARYFTTRIVKDAVEKMVADYELVLPSTFSGMQSSWLEHQTKILQKLLTRSKKTVAAMDNCETQAWDCMEGLDADAHGLDPEEDPVVQSLCHLTCS